MKPKTLVRLSLLLVLSSCSCFIQASKPNVDWTTYGGSLDNQRYSELNDINKDNVKNLRLSWEFSLPTPTSALYSNFESTPLVVGGKMYITSPIDEVYKLNTEPASKHRQIWEYKTANRYPLTVANVQQYLCCGMINRGVAVSEAVDPKKTPLVVFGTLDARLIALNSQTGSFVWETTTAPYSEGYSITAAPVISRGLVLTGAAGAERATRGFFAAYNLEDGRLAKPGWPFWTIPSMTEVGYETWPGTADGNWGDNSKIVNMGGGNAWMTAAVDEKQNRVIFGTGNPMKDLNGETRHGDNLFTSSVLALWLHPRPRQEAGEESWYFQEVSHDLWDYDQAASPILFDAKFEGRTIRAVAAASKVGWLYVLNEENGESLLPMHTIKIPFTWTGVTDYQQWNVTHRRVPDYPPFITQCNLFEAPPRSGGIYIKPAASGGAEWSPPAYSPQTGLIYLGAINSVGKFGSDPVRQDDCAKLAATNPPGEIVAIDPSTGIVNWRKSLDAGEQPSGGIIATKGGLIFLGRQDGRFEARDAARNKGNILWTGHCGNGIHAAPITYRVNGVQYVAVAGMSKTAAASLEGNTSKQTQDDETMTNKICVFALQ